MQALMDQIYVFMNTYLWGLFRIAGLLSSGPFFGSRLMPRRIRTVFAFALTLVIIPATPQVLPIEPLSYLGILTAMQQVVIGIFMGMIMQLAFQPFIIGGQLIAMQTGLGFASLVDPSSGASVPLIGQLFLFLCTLVFLALDVHLAVLKGLVNSFHVLPVGKGLMTIEHLWSLLDWSRIIFSSAIMVAMPAVFGLLVVNFAFGIMTRAAPQLNIFAIGFPFTLTLGLLIIYIMIPTVMPHVKEVMLEAVTKFELVR